MSSIEKQLLKLINDKYIKQFISEAVKMNTVSEVGLQELWTKISGSKGKGAKGKGGGKGPKKLSGYNLFLKEKRAEVKAKHGDWKTTEIVKKIGRDVAWIE